MGYQARSTFSMTPVAPVLPRLGWNYRRPACVSSCGPGEKWGVLCDRPAGWWYRELDLHFGPRSRSRCTSHAVRGSWGTVCRRAPGVKGEKGGGGGQEGITLVESDGQG